MVNWKLVFWNLIGVMKMCFHGRVLAERPMFGWPKVPQGPGGRLLDIYPSWTWMSLIWLVVQIFFNVQPYLGRWSNLTNMFRMGWNQQLVMNWWNVQLYGFFIFLGVVFFHMGHVLHIAHVSALFYMTFWVSSVEAEGCNREAKKGRRSQMSQTLSWTLHWMAFSVIAYVILYCHMISVLFHCVQA